MAEGAPTRREGVILYRNWSHISVSASHAVAERFEK